jgi:Cd2+/Zn2+-exporting ATPase
MQSAPETVTMEHEDGSWVTVRADEVGPGARVRIRPGERFGLDGVVIAGGSQVDEAVITGESIPVEKGVGDTVYAGSMNGMGALEYEVQASSGDTMLARIVRSVEQAQASKAPIQRFVDRFARVYTPIVCLIAVLVAIVPPLMFQEPWHDWIYKALVLLVIACPCALVISTPVAIVSGLSAAARHGILVKGGVYLEYGRKLLWLALDKTGTITHGKPVVTDFVTVDSTDPERTARLGASLAGHSHHPVSQAVSAGSPARVLEPVENFEAIPGGGVRGTINGIDYVLGNHGLVHESGHCTEGLEARIDQLERQGKTVVILVGAGDILALWAVADTIKPGSRKAIADLHALGVRTVMLSGDNAHTAEAIAAQVGIDAVLARQLPDDKLSAIKRYAQEGFVGMVGDGINDAPALAQADIGFAMGAGGSDTAIETADIALMDDDLCKIPRFVRLSRSTYSILVQNITLALGIKAVFLALAVMGPVTMWMAVFADVGASLLVVGNSLRLLKK